MREEIEDLIRQRVSDEEIARKFRVKISSVATLRQKLGIRKPVLAPPQKQIVEKDRPLPKNRTNPVAEAIRTLGGRLSEKDGGYWLDGRPVSVWALIDEADRLRKGWGMEPLRTW